MSLRLAILDDYQDVAQQVADWERLRAEIDIEVFHRHLGDETAVAAALADFDAVVLMRERTPFPASLLERLPRLKLIVTTGMRNLAIDMDAARARGVDVCGTRLLGYPAAEHAWALIMALVKQIPREDRVMHAGGWQSGVSTGLNGKTLGVLGLGKLGERVARVGLAFEMNVIGWSQNLSAERAAECGAARVDRDEFFSRADVISIHLVLSERTRGLVGRREFELMKPTAYLVNTSRGPIVDEAALIEALRAGRIAGAGIDVYDVEPLPADHELRSLDNAILTGHTGYVMMENYARGYGDAVEDVEAWLRRSPLRLLN